MKIFLRLFNINMAMPQLGRWYISHVPKVVTIKVDQANMDNCGVCFAEQDNGSDDYLAPFVMH